MAKLELKSVLSGTPVGGSTPYVLPHHSNAGHNVFHSAACIFSVSLRKTEEKTGN